MHNGVDIQTLYPSSSSCRPISFSNISSHPNSQLPILPNLILASQPLFAKKPHYPPIT